MKRPRVKPRGCICPCPLWGLWLLAEQIGPPRGAQAPGLPPYHVPPPIPSAYTGFQRGALLPLPGGGSIQESLGDP